MKILQQINSIIHNPNKLIAFIKHLPKIYGIRRNQEYSKFIILTRSRTGSNLLLSYLNSHPKIIADGEIFSKLNGRDYHEILTRQFRAYPKVVEAVGFKIFYYHPMDDFNCGLWDTLIEMKDLRVIHLKRKNILRTLISRKIAGKSDDWKKTIANKSSRVQEKRISFDVTELEEGFISTTKWENEGDQLFQNHPLISVYYEELVLSPEQTMKKISDFLSLPYHKPKTNLVKQNPEK